MARSVAEWIGKTDDTPVPNRVRIRVADRDGWTCKACGRSLYSGTRLNTDHIKALVNGGENRETNLQSLCDPCHAIKTKVDVRVKARTYSVKARYAGIRKPKGRPMPGTKLSGIKKPFFGPPIDRRTGKPLGRRA